MRNARGSNHRDCPRCGSPETKLNGRSPGGLRMRYCHGCGRRFSLTTEYGRAMSIADEAYWQAREMLERGFGTAETARRVGIGRTTAIKIRRQAIPLGALCACGRDRLHTGYCSHRASLHANARATP